MDYLREKKIDYFSKLTKPIETDRFIIKKLDLNFINDIFEIFSSKEVMESVGGKAYQSKEDLNSYFISVEKNLEDLHKCELFVISKEKRSVVATIAIKFKSFEKGVIELGYLVNHKAWGQGIMTECVRAVSDILRSIDENVLLQAICRTDNLASQKVLEKNNYIIIDSEFIGDIKYYRFEISE